MPALRRTPQPTGTRGSLKWMQRLIDKRPELLNDRIRREIGKPKSWTVDWRSPRRDDEWSEYRDSGFLEVIGLARLDAALRDFWPRGGPQWDALGQSSDGVVLVEAKAHFGELNSTCAAGAASRKKIDAALATTKKAYGAPVSTDWLTGHYQYANRLAHLKFLRDHGIDAQLVFLYFVGDAEMPRAPMTVDAWKEQLQDAYQHLGLPSLKSIPGLASVFIPVSEL